MCSSIGGARPSDVCAYLFGDQPNFCLSSLFPVPEVKNAGCKKYPPLRERFRNPCVVENTIKITRLRARLQQQEEKASKDPEVSFKLKVGSMPGFVRCKGIDREIFQSTTMYGDKVVAGVSSCTGCRKTNEDTHVISEISFNAGYFAYEAKVFTIFDGHGGSSVSSFLKTNIRKYLISNLQRYNSAGLSDIQIRKALQNCFLELDRDCQEKGGSTATLAMVLDGKLWVANVGDSRALIVKRDEVLQLTEDANPEIYHYREQIEELGGSVTKDSEGTYRVNGKTSMARAIGDHHIPSITANAEVSWYPLNSKIYYLVVACDGLFEIPTTDEVGKAIAFMHRNHQGPENGQATGL